MPVPSANSTKVILDLCGGTGAWSRPYREAGYTVVLVTLPARNILDVAVRDWCIGLNPYGILAAPPCTMFSIARSTPKIPRDLRAGMETVTACLDVIWRTSYNRKLAFWALENPLGMLRRFLGRPCFTFDPTEFGDNHNKKTDLWGYFEPPAKLSSVRKSASLGRYAQYSDEIPADYKPCGTMRRDGIRRSITPRGFAEAFFKANR